jgi:hypothetical protein
LPEMRILDCFQYIAVKEDKFPRTGDGKYAGNKNQSG